MTSFQIYTWNYINDAWPKYSQFIKLTMNNVEADISLPFLLLFNSWYCVISWHIIQILLVDLSIWNCSFFLYRQQGGIIIAGPGVNNISYIHKVDFLSQNWLLLKWIHHICKLFLAIWRDCERSHPLTRRLINDNFKKQIYV